MRICIVMGPWLPVPAIRGGSTGRIWQGLAEQFASKGHTVTLLAPQCHEQPEAEISGGVQYLRVPGASQSGNIVKDLIADFFYARRVKRQLPQAEITVYHDFWAPVFAKNAGSSFIFAGRMPRGQYKLYSSDNHIIVASEAVRARILSEFNGDQKKVHLVPCPVDDCFLEPVDETMKIPCSFLFVGRVHPEKGVHVLLEAFLELQEQHPEATLSIVGPEAREQGGGGATYLKSLQEKAAGANIKFFPPEYDPRFLREHYIRATYFVYPTLDDKGETFGVSPLEAMACGCVPIVSALPCFAGHIQDGKNGVVFDAQTMPVRNLKESMQYVLEHVEITQEYALAARACAENYSLSSISEQYLKLFRSSL